MTTLNTPASAQQARAQLESSGWIGRKNEAFHHLPPPALAQWLAENTAAATEATITTSPDWTLTVQAGADQVQQQQLNALDPQERQALLANLPAPSGEAAPFAWAHLALCRQGLRVQVAASPNAGDKPVRLHLHHLAQLAVDAPLLVLELAPGARCLLLHTQERQADLTSITQNLHMHIRLGEGALLQHLRIHEAQAADQLAHFQHVQVAANAQYHQAVATNGCTYHVQRSDIDLQGEHAQVRHAGLLLTGSAQIDQQIYTRHLAADTQSHVQVLGLGAGRSRTVANAFTYIAPGARDSDVHQRLWGLAIDGQPRMTLRPHLEILHDQVTAAHGATWGALPEDALFYAQQRGLDAATSRRLIIEGKARALLELALPNTEGDDEASTSGLLNQWLEGEWLASAIHHHLSGSGAAV